MELQTTHKILIIDDEENYRNIITLALQTSGYEIIEATNGLDGLAAAKMHSPDLILCDVNMPKMDGHMLLSTLKEDEEFAGIPFIFLTGNAEPGDMRRGMQLGADDYLTKPFTVDELITAVEARLAKKKHLQNYYESQFDDIKTSIVQMLPHEFRTPLNGILGFSQILMEGNVLPPQEVQEIGTMIYRSGKRLHRLLENLVLFGQIQIWLRDPNKLIEIRREGATTMLEVIRSVAEKETAKHNRAEAIHISGKDFQVQISSIHLTKILEEILDNALKFSDPGKIVQLSIEGKGSEVWIIVQDEGRGMSEEQLKKVSGFQQFERGFYEQQGAGLGLTIAKMLAELYGGSIFIESNENAGTTVRISLPIVKNN